MFVKRLLLGVVLTMLPTGTDAAGVTLYVSPQGRDAWSGRLAMPNAGKTDGPLASVGAARDRLRVLHSQGKAMGAATVLIRGGVYRLIEPVVFGPEDGGTAQAPVTYAALGNEKPILSGGRVLTGWKTGTDGLWTTSVPEAKGDGWPFHQLFVNGVRRPRPSLPADGGFYTIADAAPTTDPSGRPNRFQFANGNLEGGWRNLSDVEVLCYHIWDMSRLRIGSVDAAGHVVTFTGPTSSKDYWAGLTKGNRFRVENVFEALPREPGRWYLDRTQGVVYYHPRPGEKIGTFAPVAPRLDRLVEFRGDPAGKHWVTGIHLRGLSFQHTTWPLPPQGYSSPQAEVGLGAAITAEGARDCRLQNCEVAHVGAYAISWGRGCQRNVVSGCDLHDLGAGGVKIGETGIRPDPDDLAEGNVVKDCRIFDGGVVHPAAVGVWVGQSPSNQIVHNDIHDLYYTGVSLGWTWGYGPSKAQNNLVAYNHIWNIGRGLLSDMGGIYTLGNEQGTRLTHNLIHDVNAATYGGWGIYPDEGTTGMLVTDNVVYHTKTGGFHQHYGQDNLIQNNVFALAKEAQLERTRAEDHRSFLFLRNIVYFDNGNLLNGNWTGGQFDMDDNLYWDTRGKPLSFGGKSLADWQATGHDQHSRVADPEFVDPAKGNFALKPGSPALAMGFKPIDLTGVGARRR